MIFQNTLKKQKEELEEIRKESFKQGVWKGREEMKKEVEEVLNNLLDHYDLKFDTKSQVALEKLKSELEKK